jgi:hypothetical protein
MIEKYRITFEVEGELSECRRRARDTCEELRADGWAKFSVHYLNIERVQKDGQSGTNVVAAHLATIRCQRWSGAV